jgi:hypothetical protein
MLRYENEQTLPLDKVEMFEVVLFIETVPYKLILMLYIFLETSRTGLQDKGTRKIKFNANVLIH